MADDFRGNSSYPRGLRNNNPGNLVPVSGGWQGQVGDDGTFAIFSDIAWGIRAYIINYFSSINNHGVTTLTGYITRYAPPSENDTTAYINSVASYVGIDPNAPIPQDSATIAAIMRRQFNVELGAQYANMITDDDIAQGFALYGSPIQSLVNSVAVFYQSNPFETYGIAAAIAIGAALVITGGIKIARSFRKK